MVLYVGANKALALIPFDKDQPQFNVTELEAYSNSVIPQFSKPFIYYLGSHQGCGCGFSYGQYDYSEEEEAAARDSVHRLAEYLKQAIQVTGSVEIFSCWSGDEDAEPESKEKWQITEIGGKAFRFQECQFIELSNE